MSRAILILLVLAGLISACATLSPAPLATASLPDLSGEWTLKMSHSGGITGLARSIELSSDGKYTVTDEREKKTVEGQLSAVDLGRLGELLASSLNNSLSTGLNSSCADCYVYTIEFNGAGNDFTATVDDTTIAESGLEPLVTFLRGIIEKSLK